MYDKTLLIKAIEDDNPLEYYYHYTEWLLVDFSSRGKIQLEQDLVMTIADNLAEHGHTEMLRRLTDYLLECERKSASKK